MQERSRPRVASDAGDPNRLPPLRPQNVPLARVQREQDFGVYIISVAARILDMHPQTLRKYERLGLINPHRTVGMLRLYSREDIRKILLIRHLMDNLGLNLAGVEFALALVDNLLGMRKRLSDAAPSASHKAVVEQEMSQLFRNLNLPLEEYPLE